MNNPNVFTNPCAICKVNEATRLCDYIIKYDNGIIFAKNYRTFKDINQPGLKHETCDLPLCDECSEEGGNDVDFCPHHYSIHKEVELPKELKQYQLKQKSRMYGYS